MSYTIVPKQTPHVPELDWDNAVTLEVNPSDVPVGNNMTVYENSSMSFSGMISAIIRGTWSGSSSQGVISIVVGTHPFTGYPLPGPGMWTRSPGGTSGACAPFSKGDYVTVQYSRYASTTDVGYIYIIPYKGQTIPAQGGNS